MSKVYTINESNDESKQIPSIEYINELVKMIEDALLNINNDTVGEFKGFESIDKETININQKINNDPKTISALQVETDSNHQFLTESLINTFIDKPSSFELNQSLLNMKSDIENDMNNMYTKIVNTRNVIDKLRDISNIINEDDVLNGLLDAISSKATENELLEHSSSSSHLNNNDRKALNILLKLTFDGFADWNADNKQPNYIKNKPKSLPANGGNADTISNHAINDLINKEDYNLVIGSCDEGYDRDTCDIIAEECDNLVKFINSISSGNILFKAGNYNIDKLYIDSPRALSITSNNNSLTDIKFNELHLMNNCILKDLTISDSSIFIGSNCVIDNINFYNCIIVFDNTELSTIKFCNFNNCKISVNCYILNSIIAYNRFINSDKLFYVGGNNIINNNIGND